MLEDVLVDNLWLVLIIWVVLYVSDYTLTIATAQLYERGVRNLIEFEGGVELNPYFQRDVAALRQISPRFVIMLLCSTALIGFEWLVTVQTGVLREGFSFFIGGLFLLEAAVHMRHLRNLVTYRDMARGRGVQGRIAYRRWLVLRVSALDLAGLAALYLLTFLLTGSWFFAGGAGFCGGLAVRQALQSRAAGQRSERVGAAPPPGSSSSS